MKINKAHRLGGALLASLSPGLALAAEPTNDSSTLALPEILITGQKIERTQLETVASARVVDGDEIDNGTRMDNLYDLIESVPNVSNTSGFNSLSIRGIANAGPTGADNGAGTIGVEVRAGGEAEVDRRAQGDLHAARDQDIAFRSLGHARSSATLRERADVGERATE